MKPVWQRVARLNFDGTCFVENSKKQKYMVNIPDHCEGVRTGDLALVQKSPVSGEWNMLDYSVRNNIFDGNEASEIDVEPQTVLEDYL